MRVKKVGSLFSNVETLLIMCEAEGSATDFYSNELKTDLQRTERVQNRAGVERWHFPSSSIKVTDSQWTWAQSKLY